MDLHKKVEFKALNKRAVYPSKTTMNLAMREVSEFHPKRLVPLLIVLVIAASLFGKFAVADRLAQVGRAQAELSALQSQITQLERATAGFDRVAAEYGRYSVGWMSEEERALVPRTDMLAVMEEELMTAGRVLRCSAGGNLFSAEVAGITLDDASRVVEHLYARDGVENVSIYTATTEENSGKAATVTFLITLKLPENAPEGGDGQ